VSAGQIFINGRNVTWEEPKDRGIGMVFQSYALYPQMSVEGNLSFGLKNAGLPKNEIARRVKNASEILQIEPLLQRKPSALSGGQRQRVAIGRALVRDVDVFLFDEPLSNLDAKLRSELRVEIKRLHQRLGNTMIYVTHDQIEAMTLADRIAVMRGGLIQQLDTPHAIYSRPVNRFVAGFIGSPGMNFLAGAVEVRDGKPRFVAEDLDVPLATYAFDRNAVVAGPAELGVRPEHIGVNSGEDWPYARKVAIEVVEPMGSDTLIWAKLGRQDIAMRLPSERAPRVGDQVSIGFDPMRASLFNASTGMRL
jgi:multiple sugar transport system ATP-binding protein